MSQDKPIEAFLAKVEAQQIDAAFIERLRKALAPFAEDSRVPTIPLKRADYMVVKTLLDVATDIPRLIAIVREQRDRLARAESAELALLDLRRAMQSDYDPANELGAKLLVQSIVEKLERLTKLEVAAGNVVAKQHHVDRNKILRGSRLKQLLRRAVRNRAVRELGELLDRP